MARISEKGYEHIWDWMRLTSQVCELEHPEGDCDDMDHEVAFLLAYVLPTPERARALGVFR